MRRPQHDEALQRLLGIGPPPRDLLAPATGLGLLAALVALTGPSVGDAAWARVAAGVVVAALAGTSVVLAVVDFIRWGRWTRRWMAAMRAWTAEYEQHDGGDHPPV